MISLIQTFWKAYILFPLASIVNSFQNEIILDERCMKLRQQSQGEFKLASMIIIVLFGA